MESCDNCCQLRRTEVKVRYNSAFRLCYSLQLLPCYNEKHQLIQVFPRPHAPQCKMRRQNNTTTATTNTAATTRSAITSSTTNNHHHHNPHTTTTTTTNTTTTSTTANHERYQRYNHNHNYNNNDDGNVDVVADNDGSGGSGAVADLRALKIDPSQVYSIFWLPVVILSATTALYALSRIFVEAVGNSHQLKFPTSIDDIRDMTGYLQSANHDNPFHLLLLFSAAYVYKQTFAVPGSLFLNLLAGALFGPYKGFALVCTLTAIGATCCFLLSRTFGMAHVVKYFPDKVKYFQEKVESNRDSLFFFLLFLRLFPMTPNWVINVVSPIVGVPIHLFFLSVFIGLMPYNFICVQTGDVLSQISSANDVLDLYTMAKMAAVALVALAPGLAIKWFKIKRD